MPQVNAFTLNLMNPLNLTYLYIFPWTKKHLKGENISVFLFFLKHQSGIVVVKPRVMALN